MPISGSGFSSDPLVTGCDEQYLDWLENQARSTSDLKQVDRSFLGWFWVGTLIWVGIVVAVAGIGAIIFH
jgi:hypothetical protein